MLTMWGLQFRFLTTGFIPWQCDLPFMSLLGPLRAASLAAVLLLLTIAPAQAQSARPDVSTPTTLYFHIFDTLNAFPINTQAPNTTFFQVGGTSFPTIAAQGYDFNTIYGFATPGPVEYNFIENGQPRFHTERGIAADIKVDDTVKPVAYMYLDVRDFLGLHLVGNALPSFTFHVEMREGNQVGSDSALDAKPLIMSSQLTLDILDPRACPDPAVCQSGGGAVANQTNPVTGHTIAVPDADNIVEFRIPLDIANPTIPKADAYHMRIDWYQNPTGDPSQDDQFAEGYMRLASDSRHHPRLEMAILNPIYIEYIHPQVAAGILLIHTCVNSPWGTYDADVANMTVAMTGPSQPTNLQEVVSQNTHVHNLHDKCAEVTYLWRFRDEDAKNGDYAIQVKVPNLAHSAMAIDAAGFKIDGKQAYGIDQNSKTIAPVSDTGAKSSPAAGLAVLATALGAALLVRRRVA